MGLRWAILGIPLLAVAAVLARYGPESLVRGPQADVAAPPPGTWSPDSSVSALGRIEPEDGIMRLAGPSGPPVVVAELYVDKGDRVKVGQRIATLDTAELWLATQARWQAELLNAESELSRFERLYAEDFLSEAEREKLETRVAIARAELQRARAEVERALVRSPIAGQVLDVHAYPGEQVDGKGIVEVAKTDHMFAVAEVYETDAARVRIGQRARVTSAALQDPLGGVVEWVDLKVDKQDELGTDPAARKDARVVQVEIRLDDSEVARRFTNLQVEVEIGP